MGMPEGFAAFLARKYAIMQQQADTSQLGTVAAANLDNTKAGLLPAESVSANALNAAQAKRLLADAANIAETTKYVGPLALSGISLQGSQARQNVAQAGLIGENTVTAQSGNKLLGGFGTGAAALDNLLKQRLQFGQ